MAATARPWSDVAAQAVRPGAPIAPESLRFPAGFLFGAATAAHQVEGGTTGNNWAAWERGRRPDGTPRIAGDERCGNAVDHWRRFPADLELMRWLGIGAYRFSVEWSRVEPLPGYVDERALARYRSWCVLLRAAGITPFVTLHHFTEPLWFSERGGFENRSAIPAFVRFVEHVVAHLGDLVQYWITINEPVGYAVQGWWRGEWPPGRTEPAAAARVLENLLLAHADAYRTIHRLSPTGHDTRVGLAHNVVAFRPARHYHPLDRLAAARLHAAYNRAVLEALRTGALRLRLPGLRHDASHPVLRDTQDYLGMTHYYPMTVRARPFRSEPIALGFTERPDRNDLGWTLDPGSLREALDIVAGYRLPIIVLEHGTCDADEPDLRRQRFLGASLAELRAAVEDGVDVRGYLHWSLLDNFEWTYGFAARFGLFRVDRSTHARSTTGTAEFYRRVLDAQPADERSGREGPGQD